MSAPAVSVVLPVHDGEAHIEEAVRSVLAQTWRDFELVLCDDGSRDATPAILAALADEDPRIRLARRAAKSGVAGAADWAVRESRAALVAIAHADDLAHPERLAGQAALFAEQPGCVLTGSPAATIDWHGHEAHPVNLWRLAHPSAFAPMAHSSIMFRRAAYDSAGGYRSAADYWEDLDLYWRMARLGRVLVTTRALTTYRYSRISTRQRDAAMRVESSLERMYRCADAVEHGEAPETAPAVVELSRLHPRVFVACSWTRVWAGERAVLLPELLRRGRLRFDRATLESLGFVAWATLSPRSLRAALRLVVRVRNRWAARRLRGAEVTEWRPLGR